MTSQVRNYKIVNLRAIAILSVVLGHSIIIYSSEWDTIQTYVESPFFDSIKHIINIYQMPLYFFIAGFLMYGTLQKSQSFNQFVKDKARRLLIPYYFVGLLWMIPIKALLKISDIGLNQLSSFVLGITNGHLWFLYSLFTMFLFFYIAIRTVQNVKQRIEKHCSIRTFVIIRYVILGCFVLLFTGLALLANYITTDFFSIRYTLTYIVWFYIGLLVCSYSPKFILCLGLLFALLFFKIMPNVVYGMAIVLALFYLVPNKEYRFMAFIDKYSYGIYLFHSPLIYIAFTYAPNINPWLMFVINFVLMGGVALLISYIVKSRKLIYI